MHAEQLRRPRVAVRLVALLAFVAAYLACGIALATCSGCGLYAPEPAPAPIVPPPVEPPAPGTPTQVEGISVGMTRAEVGEVLGADSLDVPELDGQPDAVRWKRAGRVFYVYLIDGRVVHAEEAEVLDVR